MNEKHNSGEAHTYRCDECGDDERETEDYRGRKIFSKCDECGCETFELIRD